jgi:hypothetical protein
VKQIAICGRSPTTQWMAPWDNPAWECWGVPWDAGYWAKMDRFFEMHPRADLETPAADRPDDYWEKLREYIDWGSIYMHQHWDDIPCSVAYPFADVNADVFATFPRAPWDDQKDFYASSPAYALALAIHEKADRIGLWGIDCAGGSEFAQEHPNLAYLIGFAQGRGIEIILPQGPTNLLKYDGTNTAFGTSKRDWHLRYGYLKNG